MKHTTFENELMDIRRRAINELKEAIKAHGGHVELEDVYIERINDRLYVSVIPDGYYTLSIDDMSIEQIIAITEAIPETKDVKDVSGVYTVPVTWVDRDDIESAGFEANEITQDDLVKISEQMQNSYLYSGQFIEDVQYACKQCGLKEKED